METYESAGRPSSPLDAFFGPDPLGVLRAVRALRTLSRGAVTSGEELSKGKTERATAAAWWTC